MKNLSIDSDDFLSKLSILYVEDEDGIREELKSFLESRVSALHVACSGKEGLDLFRSVHPDIVISDINMPEMDGIEMSTHMKKEKKKIPIILTTAMGDAGYMTNAIKIGIDRYLLKPIRLKTLEETLHEVAVTLMNEQLAEKHKQDMLMIETLNGFLTFSPNPIIIYDGENVKFVNNAFEKISGQSAESLLDSKFAIDTLFENRSGHIQSVDELQNDVKLNKISIKAEVGRHVFYLIKNEITIGSGRFLMYTFNDITMNEYHKIKIEHYNQRLEEFIRQVNKYRAEKFYFQNVSVDVKEEIQEEIKKVVKEKRELSEMETRVLKKSRQGAVFTAEEYNAEIDEYVLQELDELHEIDEEINNTLIEYDEAKNVEQLYFIATRLVKYASVISQLFEFEDLAFAIKSLSGFLAEVEPEKLDELKHRKLKIFLSNFMMDLTTWRKTIFIEKNTHDIHYLDASLFSAILQLELIVNENEVTTANTTDDDDDFELF